MASHNDYWVFYPTFVNPELAPFLHREMDQLCQRYPTTNWDKTKTFVSKRRSAVFIKDQGQTRTTSSPFFSYGQLPGYDTNQAPVLMHIWKFVEQQIQEKFVYALVHIYETGEDALGYHNDKEALNPATGIFSLSFGATRLFRLRPIKDTKGWTAQYSMVNGSAIHMLPGCQKHFKHSVPVQKKVKEWRINITFRQNPLSPN